MIRDDGAFHRAPRPLMGWGGVLLIGICLLFILAIAVIAVLGLYRALVLSEPVDLGGFATLLASATGAGTAVWSIVKNYIQTRSYERVQQIQAGVAPAAPFASGAGDAQPNPHGGPDAP